MRRTRNKRKTRHMTRHRKTGKQMRKNRKNSRRRVMRGGMTEEEMTAAREAMNMGIAKKQFRDAAAISKMKGTPTLRDHRIKALQNYEEAKRKLAEAQKAVELQELDEEEED